MDPHNAIRVSKSKLLLAVVFDFHFEIPLFVVCKGDPLPGPVVYWFMC